MAERQTPVPIQVLDEVVRGLATIGQDDEVAWLTKPLKVSRGISTNVLTAPSPALYVEIVEVVGKAEIGDTHSDSIVLAVYCKASDAGDPEGALHALVSDVRRWFRTNMHILGGRGTVWEQGFIAGIEGIEGKSGVGVGVVRARADIYETTDSDP